MNMAMTKYRKSAKKWWVWLFILLILAALLYYWIASFFTAEPVQIMRSAVQKGDIETSVLATGILKPAKLVAVGAQASGRILSLNVTTGQQVKKNDLIAQIDATTQQNELKKAQAELVRNQADAEDKTAKLELAKQDLTRQQQMIARNAIARADYDKAVSTVRSAQAQLALSQAQIEISQIAVETAQANLNYTKILAPIDGTILATVVQEGQTVNAVQSAPTIAIIGQLDNMIVEADISEADILHVQQGQQAYFTVPGQSRKRYHAKLDILEPAPQSIVNDKSFGNNAAASSAASSAAVYYKGVFNIANPDGVLKTYMTAEINIILGQQNNVLLIPSSALITGENDNQSYVKLVQSDGTIDKKPVVTGLNDKTQVEIREGLSEGEMVVTNGNSTTDLAPRSRRARTMMLR